MFDRIGQILAVVTGVCLGAMALFTVADAIGRYFFNAPISGAIEYVAYLLSFLVVSAHGLVTRDRGHISVGVLAEVLPNRFGRYERVFSDIVTIAGCALFAWLILQQAESYTRSGREGETTGIPLDWIAYGLAFLAGIAVMFSIRLMFRPDHKSPRSQD